MFRTALLGYRRKDVDRYVADLKRYIDTMKNDIEFLKSEQQELRRQIERLILSEKIYGNLDKAQDILREYQ